MTDETSVESQPDEAKLLERLYLQDSTSALSTLLYIIMGTTLFVLLSYISWPYLMIDLFMLGLAPMLAIVAVVGATRGPLAGFLTGYLGVVIYDLLASATIVTLTLPALAYGVMGFIVGLARYDFSNGRSLTKLSVLSAVGLIFMALLVTVIGLFVEVYGELVAIGLVMLPLLTVGLPTVMLLTPLFGWTWNLLRTRFTQEGTGEVPSGRE